MSRGMSLAERKELLLAQSRLDRARVRYQWVAMRYRARSRSLRGPLLGLLLLGAGRARSGRLLVLLRRALMVATAARTTLAFLRRRR
ncbi:MAG TPA: hypothetical protein VLC53_09790 [Myxococcota bacterium]|nr:hypothetical protein [Myxococcota bacterium]